MEGLTEGRIVHFVHTDGLHKAAMVVLNHGTKHGHVDLQVADSFGWVGKHNIPFDGEFHAPNTWHWIEKA